MSFDRQPTLVGRLVELRPLRPEDQAGLYAVAADPLIWEQHPARNRHEFFVDPGNLRSRRAMERIGGVLEPEPDAGGRLVYRITASIFAARATAECARVSDR